MQRYAQLISLVRIKKIFYGLLLNRESVKFCSFFIECTCNFNFLIHQLFFYIFIKFHIRYYRKLKSPHHYLLVLLIGRPISRAGLLRKFLRMPFFGHSYRILALLTILRVIIQLFQAILSIFRTFNHPSGHFRPFLGHFSILSVVKFYDINKNSSNLSIS